MSLGVLYLRIGHDLTIDIDVKAAKKIPFLVRMFCCNTGILIWSHSSHVCVTESSTNVLTHLVFKGASACERFRVPRIQIIRPIGSRGENSISGLEIVNHCWFHFDSCGKKQRFSISFYILLSSRSWSNYPVWRWATKIRQIVRATDKTVRNTNLIRKLSLFTSMSSIESDGNEWKRSQWQCSK
jgi:hypothetical protein